MGVPRRRASAMIKRYDTDVGEVVWAMIEP